ncbi:hypothetical protein HG536_0B01470 [Torulaspora globosa]|uniref:F-box domain-containing protein n=1 Tax=Torulaspora globosa TaxID=48254 RepID=A0A7G3ZCP9_9SACH|nr:uncharacterized protein HG536_0B01470 [Torulaspora globosa]QLL31285.1 hypothetical protein HG536_0B01470 [Torulaspora globosa]
MGIKRSSVQGSRERDIKMVKCDVKIRFFEGLPHEIVIRILSLISRRDLIALSSANHGLRRLFLPYLFAYTKVSWDDLISNWNKHQKPFPIGVSQLIESLRLTGCCSKSEWTFPFAELYSSPRLPNLKSLAMPTSGSTNFFKYSSKGSHLRRLKITATKPGSVFNLEHLRPFEQLKKLSLQDYEIESFDEDPSCCRLLDSLELINCSWCYPFELENFGRCKIQKIELCYSNAFIISERFKMFLSSPNFENLNHLSITNHASNLKLTLSVQVVKLIESNPTLVTLKLNGNIYDETLQQFTASDIDNCINHVALNNVKIFYSSFFRKHQAV